MNTAKMVRLAVHEARAQGKRMRECGTFMSEYVPERCRWLLDLAAHQPNGTLEKPTHDRENKKFMAAVEKQAGKGASLGTIAKLNSNLFRILVFRPDIVKLWAKRYPNGYTLREALAGADRVEEERDKSGALRLQRIEERAATCADDFRDKPREDRLAYATKVLVVLGLTGNLTEVKGST